MDALSNSKMCITVKGHVVMWLDHRNFSLCGLWKGTCGNTLSTPCRMYGLLTWHHRVRGHRAFSTVIRRNSNAHLYVGLLMEVLQILVDPCDVWVKVTIVKVPEPVPRMRHHSE